ncbi:MAG: enoyl-CoA hydratase/isomerase family protein [Bacteroidales bacterium]|nr:enoyl-CoA hydratase/isomerase family protein [Bacteroidales bacterium]
MDNYIKNKHYTSYVIDRIGIIKFNDLIFNLLTSIGDSDDLFDLLKSLEYDKNVKALLILHEKSSFGKKVYENFLNTVFEENTENEESPNLCEKNIRFREINILNNLIRIFFDYKKLCFGGISGEIVTPFIGLSLSLDIRIASNDMKFIFAHNNYGLHPSGAVPYFFTQFLGYSKAMELQLSDEISAQKAKDIGLISHLLPEKDSAEAFEESCITIIKNYLKIRSCTIRNTKQLYHFSRSALEDYFQYESDLLNL